MMNYQTVQAAPQVAIASELPICRLCHNAMKEVPGVAGAFICTDCGYAEASDKQSAKNYKRLFGDG